MKRRVVCSCIAAAVLVVWCCGAGAAGTLRLATGQPGEFFWIMGKEFSRIWSADGLPADVVETAGDRENIELVAAGGAEAALVSGFALADYMAEHPDAPIVTITSCWESPVHVMLNKKAVKTGSVADLAGKHLYLGAEASPNGKAVRRMLGALAIEPYRYTREIAETELLSVMTDFIKQELDGAIVVGPVADPMVRDIVSDTGGTVILIPADETAVATLVRAGLPVFLSTIEAGSYAYQLDPVSVIAVGNYLIARTDLEAETARSLSAGIFDNADRIAAYFPRGGKLSAERKAAHLIAPLHPALR